LPARWLVADILGESMTDLSPDHLHLLALARATGYPSRTGTGAEMTKPKPKYHRCKKCRELVIDPINCANCANKNPLSASGMIQVTTGKRGRPTLDVQEGNREEYFGDHE
jgi:hypothetical protein